MYQYAYGLDVYYVGFKMDFDQAGSMWGGVQVGQISTAIDLNPPIA